MAVAAAAKVAILFLNYVIAKSFADAESIALLAARKEDLKADLFDLLATESIPFADVRQEVAIKKLARSRAMVSGRLATRHRRRQRISLWVWFPRSRPM